MGPGGRRIGFVGVGAMGGAMAHRLLGLGYQVIVFDTDAARAEALRAGGAVTPGSVRALAEASDVVLLSLPNPAVVETVVLDPEAGVLSGLPVGAAVIDLSTGSVELARRLHQICSAKEVEFLDAPVSLAGGSPAEGKLTIMVGGDGPAVKRWSGLLGDLGKVVITGPVGTGAAAKLATNYACFVGALAALEAMRMADEAGVDMDALCELWPRSAASSFVSDIIVNLVKERDWGTPGQALAPLWIVEKDVSLALELADHLGAPCPLGRTGAELLGDAMRRGWESYSFYRVMEILRERTGPGLVGQH